jgi:RHH-type proline utilization regulon transcriptional repressor/proline dehydrogenase/delta 1-pyrroline-5-carboxylate dehydrogenase
MGELLPKVKALALHSRKATTSASTSMRRKLTAWNCRSICWRRFASIPILQGWNGLGFVVQAYGKRCPFVLDFIIDLAARSNRRIMVRLVKGAYWDAEIKRAQLDGLPDFPVYTRKIHTDVAYIACARKLLAARDACLPAVRHSQRAVAGHNLPARRPGFFASAITSSSACTAWASRSMMRSSARRS